MFLIILMIIILTNQGFGFESSELVLKLNEKMENDHNCQYSFIFLIDKTNGSGNNNYIIY